MIYDCQERRNDDRDDIAAVAGVIHDQRVTPANVHSDIQHAEVKQKNGTSQGFVEQAFDTSDEVYDKHVCSSGWVCARVSIFTPVGYISFNVLRLLPEAFLSRGRETSTH